MAKRFSAPLATIVVVLLIVAMYSGGAEGFDNNWDAPLLYTCNSGQVLNRLYSVHSNRREDRRWDFGCTSAPAGANPTTCYWSGYANNWDAPMHFQCRSNYVIAGVNSYHSNRREDRRYKFKCCKHSGYTTRSCYLTGYVNNWDSTLRYTVANGKVLVGANSIHSNHREDRRWKLHICSYASN